MGQINGKSFIIRLYKFQYKCWAQLHLKKNEKPHVSKIPPQGIVPPLLRTIDL